MRRSGGRAGDRYGEIPSRPTWNAGQGRFRIRPAVTSSNEGDPRCPGNVILRRDAGKGFLKGTMGSGKHQTTPLHGGVWHFRRATVEFGAAPGMNVRVPLRRNAHSDGSKTEKESWTCQTIHCKT